MTGEDGFGGDSEDVAKDRVKCPRERRGQGQGFLRVEGSGGTIYRNRQVREHSQERWDGSGKAVCRTR